jgi:hypothetical protein
MDAVGKPTDSNEPSVPAAGSRQGQDIPRLRLGAEGFILGIAAFSVLSIAAPLVLAPLAQPLCALPPGQHFPPFACILLEALAFVLWLGPSALVWHVLLPAAATLGGVRLTSAIFLGLLSACLLAAYGRRKGARALVLISLILMTVVTLITVMFVSSG